MIAIALGIVGAVVLLILLPVFFELLGNLVSWAFGIGIVVLAYYGMWAFGVAFLEDSDFRIGSAIFALVLTTVGIVIKFRLDKDQNFKPILGMKRVFVWMTPALSTKLKLKKIKKLRSIDQQQLANQSESRTNAFTGACTLANSVAEQLASKLSFYVTNHIVEVIIEETKFAEYPVILIKKPNSSWPVIAEITVTFKPLSTTKAEYDFEIDSRFMFFGSKDSFSSIKKLLKKSNKYVERYVAENPKLLDKVCLEETKLVEPKI